MLVGGTGVLVGEEAGIEKDLESLLAVPWLSTEAAYTMQLCAVALVLQFPLALTVIVGIELHVRLIKLPLPMGTVQPSIASHTP